MNSILSQRDIEKAIEMACKEKAVKKEIKKYYKGRFVARYEVAATDTKANEKFAISKANEMIDILMAHMKDDTQSAHGQGLANFPKSAITHTMPEIYDPTGGYYVDICFDEEQLRRDSLSSEKYPDGTRKYSDGIKNIVSLFDRGYDARGAVFGEWHGRNTVSLRHRDASHFLQNAIKEFNEKNKDAGVIAVLRDEYQ